MQKRRILNFILPGIIFLQISFASAQNYTRSYSLNWQIITNSQNKKINGAYFLGFQDAGYSPLHPATPFFAKRIPVPISGSVSAKLQNEVYITETDPVIIAQFSYLPADIVIDAKSELLDHNPVAGVVFVPIRKNVITGIIEKLISFDIVIHINPDATPAPITYSHTKKAVGSLLASGTWYKFGVNETGIYKLDYKFLRSAGIADGADMNTVKIFGKPGGMLTQLNTAPRDNDLVQNAIQVVSSSGKLDAGSYILFYAKGPVSWNYDSVSNVFHHQCNYYADQAYYFITANNDPANPPKRIAPVASTGNPIHEISDYDAYACHELDTVTTISTSVKSGREWFGELFNAGFQTTLPHNINFDFPQADLTRKTYMRTSTAARSWPGNCNFVFTIDNFKTNVLNNSVSAVTSYDDFTYEYANLNDNASQTFLTPSTHFAVNAKFQPGASDALGWLNYVEFNVPSQLKYISGLGQFSFRKGLSVDHGSGSLNRYHISNAPSKGFEVWDVTDFHNIIIKPLTSSNNELTFIAPADVIREFVANDGSGYMTPNGANIVINQDIHGLPQPDMVIVTHNYFKQAADSVAQFHRDHDGMTVHVVNTDQVYNEFSSGTQDITAIRDMMKMFWDRGKVSGKYPQSLLLMGTASYDYKDRLANKTNFVPTYESYESSSAPLSFCSDDYYTLLADGEGTWEDYSSEVLQMSVGRFPVYNQQQAMDIFHKGKRYLDSKSMKSWRNTVCVVADDRQQNSFVSDAENLCDNIVSAQYPFLNVKKIYLDATPEVNSPAGQLFPQINQMIDENVNNGCLVMNYIGHGGQQGWAHEKVLQVSDILGWYNPYNMPLIISATCNFSTFDDPDNISAGQYALFNAQGGPFAMLTTTREVEIGANTVLDNAIMSHNLFDRANGLSKTIGKAFMDGKNRNQLANSKNFTLLGDPAIRLAVPQFDVKVTGIFNDGKPSNAFKALSLMTVTGEIDSNGKRMDRFNGLVYPTVFDKIQMKRTLGQAASVPQDWDTSIYFKTQENVIYKGQASVTNGKFTFQFVVPKDISFVKGKGKLSFYATDYKSDATGVCDTILVGQSDQNATASHKPPVIKLFMNDTNFVAGGIVNESPHIVARIHSELGINTLGSVGHDLTAELSKRNAGADNTTVAILNNFYTSDKDNYQAGYINYPYQNLDDGHYDLNVKVWDVADNSASANIDFVVINSNKLTIDKIFNFPNPFIDETTFQFEDNRPNEVLHVEIEIYDMTGQKVQDLQSDVLTTGDRQTTIHWNGMQSGGTKVSGGLYVYQLTVKTTDGQVAQKSQKMVVIK